MGRWLYVGWFVLRTTEDIYMTVTGRNPRQELLEKIQGKYIKYRIGRMMKNEIDKLKRKQNQ